MTDKMKWFKNIIYAGIILAFVFLFFSMSVRAEEEDGDWIEIVSVTPNYYANYADPVTFTATISYSLQSAEQGIIYLGFNTGSPECYTYSPEPEDVQIVSKGTGTVELSATVTPVDWGSALNLMYQFMAGGSGAVQDFKVYAMLCEYPHEDPPSPLADHAAVLTDLPDSALQTEIFYGDSSNPSREIFDCSLETIVEGIRSDEYSPQLAHMLIALCNSIHDGGNMNTTFDRMGFYDTVTDYGMSGILLAYGIGKKQVDDKTYVLVIARGTGDFSLSPTGNVNALSEWMSNILDAGANDLGQHSGFSDAANELHDRVMRFLEREDVEDFSDVRFIITGHSRGAAATNILAARLADEGIAQENIYCYTFACPDTAVIDKETAESYRCIFNIGNANDMVTWVPRAVWENSGEKDGWGKDSYWDKYGNSFWYCEDWEDYRNLHEKFTLLPSIMLDWVNKYHLQNLYLTYLRDEKELDEYKDREGTTEAINAAAQKKRESARESLEETRELLEIDDSSIIGISVFCPVDVMISDKDGNPIVSTTGSEGKIYEGGEEKAFLSFYGDKKKIFIIDEEEFDITLVGTGTGVMRFSIASGNAFQEAVTEEKVFEEVELYDGKTMHCTLNNGAEIEEARLFLVDEGEKEVAEIMTDGTEEILHEENAEEGKADTQEETQKEENGAKPDAEDGMNAGAERIETEAEEGGIKGDLHRIPHNIIIAGSAAVVLLLIIIMIGRLYKRKRRDKAAKMLETASGKSAMRKQTRYCPVCGKEDSAGAAFCKYCGSKMRR